jgi:hypothetical protein
MKKILHSRNGLLIFNHVPPTEYALIHKPIILKHELIHKLLEDGQTCFVAAELPCFITVTSSSIPKKIEESLST